MKRSEINQYIQEAKEIFAKYSFTLPPWAFFSPDEWAQKGTEFDEIRENMLGWDVTDFGLGGLRKSRAVFIYHSKWQLSQTRQPENLCREINARKKSASHSHAFSLA